MAAEPDPGAGPQRSGADDEASRPRGGGLLLRLVPLGADEVPGHAELAGGRAEAPSLRGFLERCLAEAQAEDYAAFRKTGEVVERVGGSGGDGGGGETFEVRVEKLKRREGGGETWFGRRSLHEEGKPVGFGELEGLVRKGHERGEMEYTPAIYDVNTLLEWTVGERDLEGVGMSEVELRLTQMHHAMPAPILLDDRVFTVLVLGFVPAAIPPGTLAQSIDLQIPVDLSTFPQAIQARSHTSRSSGRLTYRAPSSPTEQQKKQDGRKIVEGKYVSLEKMSKVEEGGKTYSKWEMKTDSDAGGGLPRGLQRLGVPGAIVKDVPLAVEALLKRRSSGQA